MSHSDNYILTVVDSQDVEEYLPDSGVQHELGETHGIFVDIELKTAGDYNQLLDKLVSRFGAGIFNDGEIPDRMQ